MCDTFAIRGALTSGAALIFGKNSDREPDESQVVVSVPRRVYQEGERLDCTYITIPQSGRSNAVLLSKPFWIWGAEMGVNEKGVVIGNEALFTRAKPEKSPGLIGMDLLRLGLERSDSAQEARDVIIGLLRQYGQAGACGYRDKKFTYMNSFLIADRREIIVLETVGRDYAVQCPGGHAAISNGITIDRDWERSSFEKGTRISTYNDPLVTLFSGSSRRRGQVLERIGNRRQEADARDAFEILRSHRGRHPLKGFNHDVCMHAADPLIRRSHTTGSLVVELDQSSLFRIFVTGGSSPCLTPFKPVLPCRMPEGLDRGGAVYAGDSYWWRHESFCIKAQMCLSKIHGQIARGVRELEERFCMDLPLYPWDSLDESISGRSREAFISSEARERLWLREMQKVTRDRHPIRNAFWSRVAGRSGIGLT